MKKFLLVYRTPTTPAPQRTPAELQAMLAQWQQWKAAFPAEVSDLGDGLLAHGRTIKGQVVSDGPSVESKELVSGYSIVQANDDEALAVARACPILQVPGASIEVRQLADLANKAPGSRRFLLVYRTPAAAEARQPSATELQAVLAQWQQWKTTYPAQLTDLGDGLLPTGRVITGHVVTDGPSVESKEVVSGYSIVQAKRDDEALSVARACPILHVPGASIEVRQLAGF